MIVPSGMCESEVIDTITKVAKRFANKHRFSYYESDDIFQEAFIIGMEGLERFEADRPLENFLAVHIRNRLNNLKRKNLGRSGELHEKSLLMNPLSIEVVRDDEEDSMWTKVDFLNDIQVDDVFRIIDLHLPTDLRSDFLRMKQGILIPKPRRTKIEETILEILRENGYETW